MPRLSTEVRVHLAKARESALLAVETYNRPGTSFRSGGYVVLMCIAWTALLHAIFFRRGIKPFYRKKSHSRHFEMLDGDRKAWELATCIQEFWGGDDSPIRRNLYFFIGLRNKIEHRSMPELDLRIFGECQALLFNFEELLVTEFGNKYALNASLSLALQFSHIRNEAQDGAVKALHKPLAKSISTYVDSFRSSLSTDLLNDPRYSFKVFLIPKPANRESSADVAIEWVKFDSSQPDQMERYDKIVSLVKPSGATLGSIAASATAATEVRIVNNPNAQVAAVLDRDKSHPFVQKTLLASVNADLVLARAPTINPYDLLAVRRTLGIESMPNFFYKGVFGPTQYSAAFAGWLVERFLEDRQFFTKARDAYKRVP